MASEEKIATAVVSIVNSDHAEPNKVQENQIEKAPEDLGSEEEEQRNWRGICIALLVIATVCSLIITSVVLLSPGPEEPRVKNPRFTFEEIISGSFEPRLFNGSWISDTEVTFRDFEGAIVIYNAQTHEKTIIVNNITLKALNIQSYSISPDRKYVLMSYDHEQVFKYSFTAKYKVYLVESDQVQPFLPDMPNGVFQFVTWGSKDNQMAYVYRNNIYYIESYGDDPKPTALTQSGEEGVIFNGLPDWVYEAEVFQDNQAIWWCPDGKKLAYAVFNDSLVDVMTYPWYGSYKDDKNVYPQTIKLRYPKPGRTNPKATLWVADFSDALPVTEEVMPPKELNDEQYYLTDVQWIDNSRLLAIWLRRVQNSSIISICSISDSGWSCKKHVQEETNAGWVDMYEAPVFSPNKRYYFIRSSVADGRAGRFKHVSSIDLESGRKDFLTHGSYDVTRILAYLEEEHSVYFLTTLLGKPEQRHLFYVRDMTSKHPREQKCLTCDLDEENCLYFNAFFSQSGHYYILECLGPGIPKIEIRETLTSELDMTSEHTKEQKCLTCDLDEENCLYFNAFFSQRGYYYILECLGPGIPKIEIRETLTSQLVEILDNNSDLAESLANRALPQIETFKVPLKGGYEANVRLYLPPPLRQNEIIKYPLVLHVCGSPGSQLVTEKFQIDWGSYLSSNKNYIYAHIDGRGSGYQGDKRVNEVFRQLGNVEVEDQLIVMSQLIEEYPYIDKEKIAIWGWSYGGYTAVSVLATEEEIFTCGISVAPITNWLYYDSVFSERYMRSPKPEDNYVNYQQSSVSMRAEHIRGKKFLLIHGTADDDVHLQHSMMLIKALTNAGVLFRTQIYPDEKHNLKNVKTHLYQTMEDFLDYTCFKSVDRSDMHNGR